jgi:hypothetical protein
MPTAPRFRSTAALVLLTVAAPATAAAQSGAATPPVAPADTAADRKAALAVVHRLFDAMRAGDSAAVRAAFHPQALLGTTLVREGRPEFRVDTLDGFVRAVGTPHPEVWDERLTRVTVSIDGPLAAVWADYEFWAGSRFSHCGVDAFQLARTGGGWRIVALTDTRRRGADCRNSAKP